MRTLTKGFSDKDLELLENLGWLYVRGMEPTLVQFLFGMGADGKHLMVPRRTDQQEPVDGLCIKCGACIDASNLEYARRYSLRPAVSVCPFTIHWPIRDGEFSAEYNEPLNPWYQHEKYVSRYSFEAARIKIFGEWLVRSIPKKEVLRYYGDKRLIKAINIWRRGFGLPLIDKETNGCKTTRK